MISIKGVFYYVNLNILKAPFVTRPNITVPKQIWQTRNREENNYTGNERARIGHKVIRRKYPTGFHI